MYIIGKIDDVTWGYTNYPIWENSAMIATWSMKTQKETTIAKKQLK